jgi:site-specific DNA recombinase
MHHTSPLCPAPSRTAVGYVRRSTDRQEQSIPDQKKAIERYAAENSIDLSRFFVDDAISGTSVHRRPAFQQMVREAQRERRAFSYVIVYDVKRFGRLGNDEAGYYRHILSTHGVEVIYVGENFSGDSTDDLLRPVKQWQAREESKDLSKVTIRGLLSRIEGGFWNGGTPPYGYDLRYESPGEASGAFLFTLRFQPDGTKLLLDLDGSTHRTLERGERLQVSKRDRCRLSLSTIERVDTVRRIYEMSAVDGMGLRAIASTLNTEGVPSPRGPEWSHIYSGTWGASTVRSILTNRLYVGDMVWNRRTDARFFKIAAGRASERREVYGARLVPNPKEDWINIPKAHPGIVSHQLFEAAQSSRGKRGGSEVQRAGAGRTASAWNGRRSRFLLSGIMECARCGGRYEGCRRTKGKPRADGTLVRTYYYGCGSYIRKGRSACRFGSVPQVKLEQLVVETALRFYKQYQGEEGLRRLSSAIVDCAGADWEDVTEVKRRAEQRLDDIAAEVSRILDALTESIRPLVEERLLLLNKEKTSMKTKLRGLEELECSQADQTAMAEECRSFLHDLPGRLNSSSPECRVRALRRCVEARFGLEFSRRRACPLDRSSRYSDRCRSRA